MDIASAAIPIDHAIAEIIESTTVSARAGFICERISDDALYVADAKPFLINISVDHKRAMLRCPVYRVAFGKYVVSESSAIFCRYSSFIDKGIALWKSRIGQRFPFQPVNERYQVSQNY